MSNIWLEQQGIKPMEDRLEEDFAEGWRPEPGEKLMGTVIGVSVREGEYGAYPIITVRTETGDELAFHAYHTVAKKEVASQRPEPGDRIGVMYQGKKHSRSGRDFESYRIIVEKPATAPRAVDWERMSAEAQAQLPEEAKTEEPKPTGRKKKDEVAGQTDEIPF